MTRTLLLALALLLVAALPLAAAHVPIDVGISMTGPSYIAPGRQLTYVITLDTLFPGYAYAVTDTLPPSTRFISAGGPLWNCLQSNGKVSCGNERLDESTSQLTVVVEAPATLQTIVNKVDVVSLSAFDPNPDNNSASFTTQMYDAGTCDPRHIEIVAPADHATVATTNVTLQWTPVPNATKYDVYAAQGSTVLPLIETTTNTQVTHTFVGGNVNWYVEASTNDCPVVVAAPSMFTIEIAPVAAQRRRAARH